MNPIDLFRPRRLPAGTAIGLVILRLIAGLAFMYHGYGKIQNPFGWMGEGGAGVPGIFQALAAVSEFVGGAAWMLGLLTPLFSFGLACTMSVAVYVHAVVKSDPFVASGPGGSYEPAAVYLCIAVLLLLGGPGQFSLDAAIFGQRPARTGD